MNSLNLSPAIFNKCFPELQVSAGEFQGFDDHFEFVFKLINVISINFSSIFIVLQIFMRNRRCIYFNCKFPVIKILFLINVPKYCLFLNVHFYSFIDFYSRN